MKRERAVDLIANLLAADKRRGMMRTESTESYADAANAIIDALTLPVAFDAQGLAEACGRDPTGETFKSVCEFLRSCGAEVVA